MNREELKRRSIWDGFQILFLNQQIIYKITGFSVLVVLIFYFPQAAFAQDPVLSAIEASALNYNEGQIPTPITNSITVTERNALVKSARVAGPVKLRVPVDWSYDPVMEKLSINCSKSSVL